jgi:integrase/recombinase XerD
MGPARTAALDPGTDPDALVGEAEEYLTWLAVEKGRSANTLAAYRRDLGAWQRFARARGHGVRGAGADDIVAWVNDLRSRGFAPATVARMAVSVRGLYKFLLVEDLADHDPAADLETVRVPRGLPKALTEGQITSLLEAVQGTDPVARRDRAVLEVLYGCGMRISELCGLSLGDVDLSGCMAKVFGKGAKERLVPIGRCAASALDEWLGPEGRGALEPQRWKRRGDEDAVFLNVRGGRLSRQGAWGIVRKFGERVGLEDVLTPHVLRHSCATHMLDHGADIRTVQELLGHASISTTQIYTKVSTERLVAAYREAHPRAAGRPGWPAKVAV